MTTKPMEISQGEWRELIGLQHVKECWGLADDITPEDFSNMVYGAKFEFISDSSGCIADLFVITGGALQRPVLIVRDNGIMRGAN
jgi:hypothetical protein